MVKRSLVFVFGLALALAAQPVLAASLSVTAPSVVNFNETFSVDLTLDQGAGETASLYEGSLELTGVAATIDAWVKGGSWPNAGGNIVGKTLLLSLTSNNTGSSRVLASLTVTAGTDPGLINYVVQQGAFAQQDIDQFPFVEDIPLSNLGAVLASTEVVPEPATAILLGLGLASLVVYGRRRGEE